jgi:hypothetical protein
LQIRGSNPSYDAQEVRGDLWKEELHPEETLREISLKRKLHAADEDDFLFSSSILLLGTFSET